MLVTNIKKIEQWLEIILFERFGYKFSISFMEDNIVVSLPERRAVVIFSNVITDFYKVPNHPLPCAYFDAKDTAFTTPIDDMIPQPGISKAETMKTLVAYNKEQTVVYYDILGLTYWMLSRQEEVGAHDLDSQGRFPATSSHAYQHNYLERPIVDEWLIILGQIFEKTWEGLVLKQHKFSMKVSHDVDRPSRFGFLPITRMLRAVVGSLLRKDFLSVLYSPVIWMQSKKELHSKDPYNTFNWLMDVSERNNLTSAFYFICGTTNVKYDADYKLSDSSIKKLMKEIHRRGHEIGLHPSYSTYQNKEALLSEAHMLKNTCRDLQVDQPECGGRMHYLRWEPNTMMYWEAAEMSYDSTLTYADRPGFRCGTCFEYPAINPITKEMLNLRIRPLIAMECSVISVGYLGLGTGKKAFDKFYQLKKICEKVEGCFTLLWHNSEFNKEQRKLYERVISE